LDKFALVKSEPRDYGFQNDGLIFVAPQTLRIAYDLLAILALSTFATCRQT
jgi:hypothetical protein